MTTDPPRPGPPRVALAAGFSGPDAINGSGRSKTRQEPGRGAPPAAAERPSVALPVFSGNAMPRFALAVLALAIAMFGLGFMHVWKGAEFAAAALFGLAMILLLLTVVADGNKSPL